MLFEGDAKGVIDFVNLGETKNSSIGHIIEDIKWELRSFQQWQLVFIRKEGNKMAHLLVRSALEKTQDFYWRDGSPDCIHDALLLEQSALVF